MRCARCGNENSEGNRFCGMCGAGLIRQEPVPEAPVATSVREQRKADPAPTPHPAESHRPGRFAPEGERTTESPTITGPSFLGLNQPADGGNQGSHPDHRSYPDPLARSSGSLDYLLDDEEEPKRGWGKMAAIVIAVALVGGLGYLRWKQGGFDWPTNQQKTPVTAEATPSNGDSTSAPSSNTPPATASTAPAVATPSNTTSDAGAAAQPSSAASGAQTQTAPQPSASSPNPQPNISSSPSSASPQDTQDGNAPSTNAAQKTSANKGADSAENSSDTPADSEAGSDTPVAAPARSEVRKPRERKPSPVTPVDDTATAERYIYGRGVPQDCDRGLSMLKSAAGRSDANAMVKLGALYSSGNCAPRDLPTAYRWFALALHKQPDNQRVQDDLQKLWGQMTPPERQLAIKLSQ